MNIWQSFTHCDVDPDLNDWNTNEDVLKDTGNQKNNIGPQDILRNLNVPLNEMFLFS